MRDRLDGLRRLFAAGLFLGHIGKFELRGLNLEFFSTRLLGLTRRQLWPKE
jgi:hypothetical protein